MWSPVQGAAANRLGEAVTFENQLSWLGDIRDDDYQWIMMVIISIIYDDLMLIYSVNLFK